MTSKQDWPINPRVARLAEQGNPEARFVVHVLKARQNGAPQYGAMFKAWLERSGVADPDAAIRELEAKS